jgi:chorismate mutase
MTQVERLARPAINEGLVLTDKRMALFNAVGPSKDLSDAAAPVREQAVAVLTALNKYGSSNGLKAPAVADVATGFLPDVMRIDTSKKVAVGTAAYNSDFVIVNGTTAGAMLTGGRKLEDDVMDVTLSYLLNGDPTGASVKDGVSYAGGTTCANAGQGSNPGNPGHRCLNGQTTRLGSATFPFLATPQ